MTSLICISHGKCGTTFLDTVFRHRTKVAVSVGEKEIKYFHRQNVSLGGYADCFGASEADFAAPGFVSFEASPPYVTNQKTAQIRFALEKIKSTLPDPRILIAIRNPVERALSHYWHTLYEVSQRGYPPKYAGLHINYAGYPQSTMVRDQILENPCYLSIEQALQDKELCYSSYSDAYQIALELFGAERITFFSMERDCRDFPAFLRRLQRDMAIDFEWDDAPLPKALISRGIPYYIHGGKAGCSTLINGTTVRLKPYQLLIMRSEPALLFDDVSVGEYQILQDARDQWTTSVSEQDAKRLYDQYLRSDFEAFLDLYCQEHWESSLNDVYRNMKISGKVAKPARFEGELVKYFKELGEQEDA